MTIQNRTIFENDNLYVMRGMDSQSVYLIYLDPPFNSNRNYAAPIDSEAAGAAFKDTWTLSDLDNAWHGEIADREPALYAALHASEMTHGKGMKSYLIMIAIRMLEMKRILKDTGSIYLHCDPTASHYLKLIMDSVFGKENFRNEIMWHYYNVASTSRKFFGRKHDTILFYSKSKTAPFNWDDMREPYSPNSNWVKASDSYRDTRYKPNERGKLMHDVWRIPTINNMAKERTGYPTQKPMKLIERIIQASSNSGDMVLDPFCGCATTCVAAEKLQRQWIGIDISPKGIELVKYRFNKELGLDERDGILGKIIHRTDIPRRSEKLPNYRTHKHVLYGEQEGNCNGCHTHFPFKNMTIDHIIPQSKGGTDHQENLQLLCNFCNSLKGMKTQQELIVKLQEHGIIN